MRGEVVSHIEICIIDEVSMNAGINKTYAALLELTARAISKSQADTDTVLSVGVLSDDEWRAVYEAAVRGGVCALVWDAVQRLDKSLWPPRGLRLQWGVGASVIASGYKARKARILELTDRWAEAGIKTYCLKGLALSQYYPKPELRESGDFDCWLGDDFDLGNKVAVSLGATFDPHDYRHSVLTYNGLKVENHRYFLAIRGNERHKRLERYLHKVIVSDSTMDGCNLYYPSSQFHAMFLTMHALNHFLYEGIRLRHLCDWVCFVNAERANVDWAEFNRRCEQVGASRFVAAMNAVCVRYLGLDLSETGLACDDRYALRLLMDTLDGGCRISGISSLWQQRMAKIRNMVDSRWKFRDLYDRNFLSSIMRLGVGVVADPDPKI